MTEREQSPRFVGRDNFPELYAGRMQLRDVYGGGRYLGEPKRIRPVCQITGEEEWALGAEIYDPDSGAGESVMTITLKTAFDPFLAWRFLMMVECLPELRVSMFEAMIALAAGIRPQQDQKAQRILEFIGDEKYLRILEAVPSELREVVSLLQRSEVKINTLVLQDELMQGRLRYEPWMKELELEHPEEIRRREKEDEGLAKPYREVIQHRLEYLGSTNEALRQRLQHYVAEAIRLGLQEADLVIGVAETLRAVETMLDRFQHSPDASFIAIGLIMRVMSDLAEYLEDSFPPQHTGWQRLRVRVLRRLGRLRGRRQYIELLGSHMLQWLRKQQTP